MGWKTATVIVDRLWEGSEEELAQALGFGGWIRQEDTTMNEAFSPVGLHIGRYEGCTLMFADALVYEDRIRQIAALFPGARVGAFQLHGGVDLYAYYLFENDRFIRSCSGTRDEGLENEGELRPAEREHLAACTASMTKRRNAEGEIVYIEDGEEYAYDEFFGEATTFLVMEEFLGFPPDMGPQEFWDTRVATFEDPESVRRSEAWARQAAAFKDSESKRSSEPTSGPSYEPQDPVPWWKRIFRRKR